MLACWTTEKTETIIPITPVVIQEFDLWLADQDQRTQNWIRTTEFRAEKGAYCLLSDSEGCVQSVIICVEDCEDFWSFGALPLKLPAACYQINHDNISTAVLERIVMAWGLGSYQFSTYKKPTRQAANLLISDAVNIESVTSLVESIYLVRDLINTPTQDMVPADLAEAVYTVAKKVGGNASQIIGDDLLTENYPVIHAVGRASDHAPRLIGFRWGNPDHPKVSLVGKGVCFDTGGLNLKPGGAMSLMKKDMGGAAHMIALAQLIVAAKLPVCLRMLVPAVENSVSGNSYRPGDILTSRKGLTVEITNTDAEGRLVLADALTEAASETPDLLIDFGTLTGAQKVATGPDIPGFYTRHRDLVAPLMAIADEISDPVWPMPLYQPYREFMNSNCADLKNAASVPMAGAITAALFLAEFVPEEINWIHFDFMAWNTRNLPGRPVGGEAMGLRTVFEFIKRRYS